MIQNIEKGRGFRGVLNYALGKDGAEIIGGTMYGENPRALAAEFRSFRELRPEVGRAVFHASLSAPHGEHLSDTRWAAVAERYAEEMGFAGSPYVVIRHRDAEHEHVHIIASRVDVRGRVVSQEWDYYRGQAVLRDIERDNGLTPVASSWESPGRQLTRSDVQRLREGQQPFAEVVRARAIDAFRGAHSWDDLDTRLGQHGLRVEAKRSGLVVTDGVEACKASDVGRECSRGRLDQRFGVTYAEWRAERDGRDRAAEGSARAAATGRVSGGERIHPNDVGRPGGVARGAERARTAAEPVHASGTAIDAGRDDRGAHRSGAARGDEGSRAHGPESGTAAGPGHTVAGAPARMDGAREGRHADAGAGGDAGTATRDGRPGAGVERSERPADRPDARADRGGIPERGTGAAGAPGALDVAAGEPRPGGSRRDRGGSGGPLAEIPRADGGAPHARVTVAVATIRDDLARIEARQVLEARYLAAQTRAHDAGAQVAAHERAQRHAAEVSGHFGASVAAVYRDPTAARAAIERVAEGRGVGAALDTIRREPATFGELRGGTGLALSTADRRDALSHVSELAARAGEHFAAGAVLRHGAPLALGASRDGAEARAEAVAVAEQLRDFMEHQAMLDHIHRVMGQLAPDERDQVRAGLAPSDRSTLDAAADRVAAHGRSLDDGWER
jgi:hypothetical protein